MLYMVFIAYYNAGLSTRQIAELTGYSASYIHKRCAAVTRTQSKAAQLRQPPTSTHWRSSRQAARKLVERTLGRKLETTEHVHHKNHDYTDNRIENLEILDQKTHAFLHHPSNPIPRWLRPERQKYMKEYLRNYRGPSQTKKL